MPKPLAPALADFGARVRSRRHELGLTQEQLAERTGLHWTYIGQVERGQRNLSLRNILRLATGLQLDAGDLITRLRAW